MTELHEQYPDDVKLRSDLIVLLSWNGDDGLALKLFEEDSTIIYPDYALFLVAGLYRQQGKSQLARVLLDKLLLQKSNNERYQLLKAQLLIDSNKLPEARKVLSTLTPELRGESDYHKIDFYLESSDNNWLEALGAALYLAAFPAEKNEAVRGQVVALRSLAAPFVASKI